MDHNPFVVFVGQPNSGKTTLFNHVTGSRFKIVNYPGATVDYAIGKTSVDGQPFTVMDTPGITSIIPRSDDERITLNYLTHIKTLSLTENQNPDVVVVVVDSTKPTRHLILVRQLQDAGFNVMVALTMVDIADRCFGIFNIDSLSEKLNCPVVGIDGRTGRGVNELKKAIIGASAQPKNQNPIVFPDVIPMDTLNHYYQWADALIKETCRVLPKKDQRNGFDWDKILLHPTWGLLIFAVIMFGLFWSIFTLASPFIDAIDGGFSLLAETAAAHLPQTWWAALFTEGLIKGFGAVFVFVPQIAFLFFLLSILESSGYLARGAVLIDKPLSMVGLNGKSFVPLLSGCACAIPAMMAARAIPSKKERLITLFIIPLMNCSARLPVYGLLLSLLFFSDPVKGGIGMTLIYFGSIALASIIAAIMGKVLRMKSHTEGFQIELPRWHRPILKHILVSTYDQTMAFVKKASTVIVVISIVLWVVSSYPSPEASYVMHIGSWIEPVLRPMGVDWRVGVGLILAFAAREVFVSVLALMFSVGEGQDDRLLQVLHHATSHGSNTPLFTIPSIVGLIVFFMISMQCASTVAVAKKEMGGWVLPTVMTVGYILLAYISAVITFQALSLFF
jgi:ferrous iron transport protein B